MSGAGKNNAEKAVEEMDRFQNGTITFAAFSKEFEEFGRSRNIPLIDILNWKEDLMVMAMREKASGGEKHGEHYLFMHFEMFKAKYATPLPKGTKPVTVPCGSDSE